MYKNKLSSNRRRGNINVAIQLDDLKDLNVDSIYPHLLRGRQFITISISAVYQFAMYMYISRLRIVIIRDIRCLMPLVYCCILSKDFIQLLTYLLKV